MGSRAVCRAVTRVVGPVCVRRVCAVCGAARLLCVRRRVCACRVCVARGGRCVWRACVLWVCARLVVWVVAPVSRFVCLSVSVLVDDVFRVGALRVDECVVWLRRSRRAGAVSGTGWCRRGGWSCWSWASVTSSSVRRRRGALAVLVCAMPAGVVGSTETYAAGGGRRRLELMVVMRSLPRDGLQSSSSEWGAVLRCR